MRIGIVTATPEMAAGLEAVVRRDQRRTVAWVTHSVGAVDRAASEAADLLILDLRHHAIDAVEATKQIMAMAPCPILLVTECVHANAGTLFEAVGVGALDAVEFPVASEARGTDAASLAAKIETLSRLIVTRPSINGTPVLRSTNDVLVAIGASAGGPAAVRTVLAALPPNFPAAVVIVQHVGEQFIPGMLRWLDEQSRQHVMLAEHGLRPQRGQVLMAGRGGHLTLTPDCRFAYSEDPRHCPYQPSIDVFFESVAQQWRGHAIGVLLTGMGRDGADGLKKMRDRGHHTIAQDEATSAVYGMPKAAASIGAAVEILSLAAIADRLSARVNELYGRIAP